LLNPTERKTNSGTKGHAAEDAYWTRGIGEDKNCRRRENEKKIYQLSPIIKIAARKGDNPFQGKI